MYEGITPTKFGRHAAPMPMRLDRMHLHRGEELREVDHESPLPVLDQEDLLAQGIDTSALVPGAAKVDALGSCTCNSGTAHLAERYAALHGAAALPQIGLSTTDSVGGEKFAIKLYHDVTDQTGDPAQEWPPTDCGSTGLYVCTELEKKGLASGHKTASGIRNVVSLLQGGTVMVGLPWFEAWMEPDSLGFVDGDGGIAALERAISSGVAGGHETCITAVERLTTGLLGRIDGDKSHVRVRNSWSESWGDHGSYRIHLSTLALLGAYADYKQLILAA
jgi:hypothetical protein